MLPDVIADIVSMPALCLFDLPQNRADSRGKYHSKKQGQETGVARTSGSQGRFYLHLDEGVGWSKQQIHDFLLLLSVNADSCAHKPAQAKSSVTRKWSVGGSVNPLVLTLHESGQYELDQRSFTGSCSFPSFLPCEERERKPAPSTCRIF